MSKPKRKSQKGNKAPAKAKAKIIDIAELEGDALDRARQEMFAQNLVKGMRTCDAYRSAGYTAKNDATAAAAASRLLRKVSVRARVEALKTKAADKAQLSHQWIIERLMRGAQVALGEVTLKRKVRVKEAAEAVEVEVTEWDPSAGFRALELLGKTNGQRMFVDQVENGGPGSFRTMSEDELDDYIAERNAIALYEAGPGSDSIN